MPFSDIVCKVEVPVHRINLKEVRYVDSGPYWAVLQKFPGKEPIWAWKNLRLESMSVLRRQDSPNMFYWTLQNNKLDEIIGLLPGYEESHSTALAGEERMEPLYIPWSDKEQVLGSYRRSVKKSRAEWYIGLPHWKKLVL